MPRLKNHVKVYAPLWIALLIYGGAAFHQLHLPGLHHDEAQEAGLMAMQINNGLPPVLFREVGFVFGGRAWPVMVQDYIGALNVYLAWLAFALGGVSVESLRAMTIITGGLTIMAAFGAARAWLGWRTAALSVLLLAVHPTFIFWTRQGVYVTSYILLFALLVVWLLAVWRDTGRAWPLALAAFLIGLGLWGKLLFIWFVAGLIGAGVLVYGRDLWRFLLAILQTSNVKNVGTSLSASVEQPINNAGADYKKHAVSAFYSSNYPSKYKQNLVITILSVLICGLIGLAPLLYYNLESGGTFRNITDNLDASYYGVNNADFGANFRERLRQAPIVFASGHMGELGGLYQNPLGRVWLILAALLNIIAALRRPKARKPHLALLILVGLMLIQSSFTSTALWYTHFALILPFMLILSAAAWVALTDLLQTKFKRYLPAVLIAVYIAFELLTLANYHQVLGETGGLRTHSAAIYALTDELDRYPPAQPVAALDWGISPAVEMLTEARIIPNEVFGYTWETDGGFSARLAPFLALDHSLYVLHVPSETVFPRRDSFFEAVSAAGKTPELHSTIFDQRGQPYFEIWVAK